MNFNEMWPSHLWLALGWILYGAIHSILASRKFKEFLAEKSPFLFRNFLFIYIFIATATLLILAYLLLRTPSLQLWNPGMISWIAGMITILTGSIIMIISLRVYFSTFSSLQDLIKQTGKPVLQQQGLLRYVRHPLYLGTFLLLWGCFLILPYVSILVTNIIITLYTLLGIRFEEKKLIGVFGDAYIQYRKSVPMIWPGFKKHARDTNDPQKSSGTA